MNPNSPAATAPNELSSKPDVLPTDLVSCQLNLRTEAYDYRTPMKFGGRVVRDVAVLDAVCQAKNAAGSSAVGYGSMTMGITWAWPSPDVSDAVKLEAVLAIAAKLAEAARDVGAGHAMELCLRLGRERDAIAKQVAEQFGLTEPIPELAVLMAGSPIEAALFDAQGKAAGMSCYAMLGPQHLRQDLGDLLGEDQYRGLTLDRFVSRSPVESLPLYHLVGALDPLTEEDVESPVGDGLPETLGEWITRNELTHLKIKLNGDDLDWDFDRIRRIDSVASQTLHRGASTGKPYSYSLDFNERCADEQYVLDLLEKLRSDCPTGLERLQYIEQPTHRDLRRPDAVTMHRAAKIKPVVIDESLTDLESLRLAVSQGYSGIALKACKGHAEAILLGAVAQHEGLFLCVQDLTCIGRSLLHSASLSAHIPSVAAVESNGRQYCPAGNSAWSDSYGPMFEIRGGSVPTGMLSGEGLGF